VHRYVKYNLKKREATRAAGPLCSPYHPSPLGPTRSFVVGFYPRRWVLPLRPWVLPFVVGSYPSSLGPRSYPSSLGLTLRRWALPFVIGPYHSSLGLRRCVLRPSQLGLPLRFGFTLRCWVLPPEGSGCDHLRVIRHEGGGCERRQVGKAVGLNTLVLFNTKAVSCWSVRRRRFDLLAWVSSSSCHRRGPSFVVTGPYSLSSGRRLSFGLRSPLVPLVVAAPHPHGRWVFVSLAGRCWFSG